MSTMTGCDYGASTDYRLCTHCGCRRPVAAMESDGTTEGLLRCSDSGWCQARHWEARVLGVAAEKGGGSGEA